MTDRAPCAEIRLLLPELALGTLTGEDRGRVLEHLAGCLDCRREARSLSEIADEMLLLTPSAEAPVGFESRVMERLGVTRRPPRFSRGRVVAAAAVLVAALAGGLGVYLAGAEDREIAGNYRRTLSVADGEYFEAQPILDEEGAAVGHIFGYQGSPSWVFCVVHAEGDQGVYEIQVAARGDVWTAGEMSVREGKGTWAQPLSVDLHDVRRISFVDRSTGEVLIATW